MSTERHIGQIREGLQRLMPPASRTFEAEVLARDDDRLTVEAVPLAGGDALEVSLKAADDGLTDGVVEFPAVGSVVLIAKVGAQGERYAVVKCSAVDKVTLYGGTHGGLVNWPACREQLEKNTAILQSLLNILTGTPVNEPGNGSPSALQAALSTALAGQQPGDFEDLENTKITH